LAQAFEGELLDDAARSFDPVGDLTNRLAWPTTRLVEESSLPYPRFSRSWLCGPFARVARAMSSTRSLTLRLRSRSFAPTSPTIAVIFFIARVRTRTPSPSRLESVG